MKSDENEIKPTSVTHALALLSINKSFISRCRTTVTSVLKPFIPPSSTEYKQIVEDAIAEVTERSLKWASAVDRDTARQIEVLGTFKTSECVVSRYLFIGVKRLAFYKRRRWMHDDEKGIYGYAARVVQVVADDNCQESWLEQQQASQILFDNELDLVGTSSDPIAFLRDKGLKSQTIEIIFEKLSGTSYADIARQRGGSEDKYRKLVKRALNSIGLDINLDKLSAN